MKSFRINRKAISPIFATLILIAIAVIAGIVVYMFTSGSLASMTGGGTAGQEKVAVQGVDLTAGTALAQNMGTNEIVITNAIVKDNAGTVISNLGTGGTLPAGGALTGIPFTVPDVTGTYTVTIVSSNGGSFVSPSFPIAGT
jgi:flagellin-like protein